jgi:NADH:ubiquinone oxidoreductase subunit F (NADH-binding)/(2Fe-2S) ferredoxin
VSNHAFEVKRALEEEIARHNLTEEVAVVATGCNGFCERGPVMVVQPEGIFYTNLTVDNIPHLVEEHFLKGRPVKELMYTEARGAPPIPKMNDIEFFRHQVLVALRNRGRIDPERIEEYIANDGYAALAKVLEGMSPEEVIDEVKKSGLRGRGGAGFPAGMKWEFARRASGDVKYLVCNADEGDPGAFMDRSILEADPHSVLEGMLIGAYAIGASEGFIYVREEYPLAVERIKLAIRTAEEHGLLGEGIFGTDFNFSIRVVRGAGAFVCGEETALMASIEGRMGRPRPRPPFPAESGLWGRPTNINNVETWANVPVIMLRGGDWYSSIGTASSKGTKVFSVVGKVQNTGLVEVPMGITLRQIIFDIGGGIPNDKEFKAVQTGGPSGGCIPESGLDLQVDFEQLAEAGAIMGSGGLIVMDEDTCMVDLARYFVVFLEDESCGKCVPCREGLQRMHEILDDITHGRGTPGHLELLERLANTVKHASLCGLGSTAPNPVLTTIRYFRDEYEAHIQEKRCPAGVCKALIEFSINAEACTGCTACIKACPTHCITGEKKQPHKIDVDQCIKCGGCYEVCKFNAVVKK